MTYVAGHPDSWALAPASPLPPFEDDIGAFWIVLGPLLLCLAPVYWLILWFANRRAEREARLVKDGALIGAELSRPSIIRAVPGVAVQASQSNSG